MCHRIEHCSQKMRRHNTSPVERDTSCNASARNPVKQNSQRAQRIQNKDITNINGPQILVHNCQPTDNTGELFYYTYLFHVAPCNC